MCKLANLLVDKKVLMAEIAHNLGYLEKQAYFNMRYGLCIEIMIGY